MISTDDHVPTSAGHSFRSPLRRKDGDLIVTGQAEYLEDVRVPGMIHAAILRSPHAHARILSVDVTTAASMPGVRAVLSGQNADGAIPVEHFFDPGKFGLNTTPVTVLATDKVRWVGDPVAAVAADSLPQAEAAVRAIKVEYEMLPPVVTISEALQPDAPKVFEDWSENAIGRFPFAKGDADSALSAAPHRLKTRLSMGRHQSVPMETRGYLASWTRNGRITFWGSVQSPHPVRTNLSKVLGLPEERIRVVGTRMGGGFGHKFTGYTEETLVCLLSRQAGLPVRWLETRGDSMLVGAREFEHEVEAGYDNAGKLVGLKVRMLGNVGCLATWGGWPMVFVAGMAVPGPYHCVDYAVEAVPVVTNKAPWTGYRGYGKEQATFVLERVMDLIAEALGIDPAEVRQRNFLKPEQFPYWTQSAHLDSGNYPEAMRAVLELAKYSDLREWQMNARQQNRMIGIGIGFELVPEGGDLLNSYLRVFDTSTVRVHPTGGVTVLTGVTSPGTGNETTIAHLVARELGISVDRVEVVQGDTDRVPYGFGSFTSRAISTGGAAAVLAAREIRQRMDQAAAVLLQCPLEAFEYRNGIVRSVTDPSKQIEFAELAESFYKFALGTPGLDNPLLEATKVDQPHNYQHVPDELGRTSTYATYPFSANITVVELDPDTGIVTVLHHFCVDDCGVVINRHFVDGQIFGAAAQGIGGALWENSSYDHLGRPLATNFKQYLTPRAPDLPTFKVSHQETPSPYTLLGTKGAGESGICGALASTANAVNDALSPIGVEVNNLPLDPPTILAAISHQDVTSNLPTAWL